MAQINFGRGLLRDLSCFGPSDHTTGWQTESERDAKITHAAEVKYDKALKWLAASNLITPEQHDELWGKFQMLTPDEQHAMAATTTRKVGGKKGSATRKDNKVKAGIHRERLKTLASDHTLLVGSRWVVLQWLRKDWKQRMKAYSGLYEAHILEVVIVDPKIPIAFARIPVVEPSDVSSKIRFKGTDGNGNSQTFTRKKIVKPDWRYDEHRLKAHVCQSTWQTLRKIVGAGSGVPHLPAHDQVQGMKKMAHDKWYGGSSPRHLKPEDI